MSPGPALVLALAPLAAAGTGPAVGLSPYELANVALDVADRIDFQWGIFITVHLALFGGIIYVDRPLRVPEKVGALLIYLGFALLSYRLMDGQIALMQQAYEDIAALFATACCIDSQLLARMSDAVAGGKFEGAKSLLLWSHLLMPVLVVVSVIFDQALTHVIRGETSDAGGDPAAPKKGSV